MGKVKWPQSLIDHHIGRLPRAILVNGRVHTLDVRPEPDDNAYWILSYSSQAGWPDKKVFMHYEEKGINRCVSKAWRKLATTDNWKEIPQENEP